MRVCVDLFWFLICLISRWNTLESIQPVWITKRIRQYEAGKIFDKQSDHPLFDVHILLWCPQKYNPNKSVGLINGVWWLGIAGRTTNNANESHYECGANLFFAVCYPDLSTNETNRICWALMGGWSTVVHSCGGIFGDLPIYIHSRDRWAAYVPDTDSKVVIDQTRVYGW